MAGSVKLQISLTAEQKSIYAGMPAAWRSKATAALAFVINEARTVVLSRHGIGKIVTEVSADEGVYGTAAVRALVSVLGIPLSTLYTCQLLAAKYTRQEIETLLSRGLRTGYHMTFSHLGHLATLPDDKRNVRTKLESKVVDEKMSVRDLRERISKLGRTDPRISLGELKLPRTMMSGIQETRDIAAKYLKRFDFWSEGVFDRIDKAGPDQVDETLLSNIQEARESQKQLRDRAEALILQYDRAEGKVRAMLDGRQFTEKGQPEKKQVAAPSAAGTARRKKKVKKRRV